MDEFDTGFEPECKKARTEDTGLDYRLEHFKVKHDQTWNYTAIADKMFDGPKVMVQWEKWSSNPHVHFQGLTSKAPRTFEQARSKLGHDHFSKILDPKCHPVKGVKTCDEKGFQYLLKEGHDPLYVKGFTQEELDELKGKSDEHVEKLKTGLKNYLHERVREKSTFYSYSPEAAWNELQFISRDYYTSIDKTPGRYHRYNLVDAMSTLPKVPKPWIIFAMNKL